MRHKKIKIPWRHIIFLFDSIKQCFISQAVSQLIINSCFTLRFASLSSKDGSYFKGVFLLFPFDVRPT